MPEEVRDQIFDLVSGAEKSGYDHRAFAKLGSDYEETFKGFAEQVVPVLWWNVKFLANEAPRSKAPRYLSEILRSPSTLLRQGYGGFSSPSSSQQAARYSAKENKIDSQMLSSAT
jgi:hypothetical protein